MIQSYVALDLETTGLNPARDRILEIGAVKIKNGREEGTFSTLVDVRMAVPEHIRRLTGIDNEMIEEARVSGRLMETEDAVRTLIAFCEELPLLGHNILFDYSFVKQAAFNTGQEFEAMGVDTLKIARRFLHDLPSRSLEALCAYYGIDAKEHHRAAEDAYTAAKLYEKLAEAFEEGEERHFCPEMLLYRAKKQCPATKIQKAYLLDLIKYHKINVDVSIDSLTKNEASRMIDKILFSYGKIKR